MVLTAGFLRFNYRVGSFLPGMQSSQWNVTMRNNREVLFTRSAHGMRVTVESLHKPPRRLRRLVRFVALYGNLAWLAYDRESFVDFYWRWLTKVAEFLMSVLDIINTRID